MSIFWEAYLVTDLACCSASMEKHKCRLCSRTFSNGRALGGHMKGHLTPLPVPHKSAAPPSTSSGVYGLRENPKKSLKLADPELSAAADSGSVENPTRKRSKMRNRKQLISRVDSESSECNSTQEEALAICLMMLSRGNRAEEEEVKVVVKMKKNGEEIEGRERRFECPFCFRVFGSGQALGGHKRSHFFASFSTHSNLTILTQNLILDLNLPPPLEDDHDDFTVLSEA